MKNLISNMDNYVSQKHSKSEKILFGLCLFLLGIIFGFIFAPIKKGLYIGSNNGNKITKAEPQPDFSKKAIPQKASESTVSDEELFVDADTIPHEKKAFWHIKK